MKTSAWFSLLPLALAMGCGGGTPEPKVASPVQPSAGHVHTHNPSDHNHARGKMLLASDGTTNALLTAHLAKAGNELDIFFDRGEGKAVALSQPTVTAVVSSGSGAPKELSFECAPADERPQGEPAGTCSHFVAKAPWMEPTDTLKVETTVTVEGKRVPFTWTGFNPRQYAHHEE